ncbi:MAG TPA: hypothetical protein VKG01_01200 [Thermoanaerobaculia bacterium]|nr:hypothetical protein [Thermoanaerobaculia bacterium]
MDNNVKTESPHLTDPELFTLALPPAGEPEALPRHLSECLACSRALLEWKSAVRETAQDEIEEIERRTPADWEAVENKTIEAMRRARRPRQARMVSWGLAAAAALLLAVVLLPSRKTEGPRSAPPAAMAAVASAEDQSDDALLRDVARLSRGEDNPSWHGLAPVPAAAADEELL